MSTLSKGNAWRRKVEVALARHGYRTSVRGIGRPGDDITVHTRPPLSVEAKNHRSYNFGGWVDQAERQRPPLSVPVVWAHRTGRAEAEDGFVVMSGRAFLRLLEELA